MFKKGRNVVLVLILSLLFLVLAGLPAYVLYPVAQHSQAFKLNAEAQNEEGTRREFKLLQKAYGVAEKYKLKWLADRYLLKDIFLYEPALDLITVNDYDKVIGDLEKYGDDYRANHMIGVAMVRKYQSDYAMEKDPLMRKRMVKAIIEIVNPYFEKAVKMGPSSNFSDQFNYDITSTEASARDLLENKKPPRQLMLGTKPKDIKEPGAPQRKAGEEPKLDEEKKPGGGNPTKKG